jgi:hypothetical protein
MKKIIAAAALAAATAALSTSGGLVSTATAATCTPVELSATQVVCVSCPPGTAVGIVTLNGVRAVSCEWPYPNPEIWTTKRESMTVLAAKFRQAVHNLLHAPVARAVCIPSGQAHLSYGDGNYAVCTVYRPTVNGITDELTQVFAPYSDGVRWIGIGRGVSESPARSGMQNQIA